MLDMWLLWLFVGLAGACIGSFLNVVIGRLPVMMEREWTAEAQLFLAEQQAQKVADERKAAGLPELTAEELTAAETEKLGTYNLLKPASHCPKCLTPIKFRNNLPIIGWLILRGKCAQCSQPISPRYPIVEALGAIAALASFATFGLTWTSVYASGFLFALITLTFIDADTFLLPDVITLPLVWVGLIINLNGTFTSLSSAVIGAVAGYMILWTVNAGYKLIKHADGMGNGDFKLLAALGAWFGWSSLPAIILLSAGVGLVFALVQRLGASQRMPFGPYLAMAGVLALFYREPINAWLFPLGA